MSLQDTSAIIRRIALAAVLIIGSAGAVIAAQQSSVEVESGTIINATIENDATASGGNYVQFGSVPAVSTRGPTGLNWPPNTPVYTVAATIFIDNLSDLNSALGSASSGDVIEVSPHTFSPGSTTLIDSGDAGWAQNVLVRPPIGQRQSVIVEDSFTLDAPHVTIAGFRFNDTFTMFDKADRSAYARIVMGQQSFMRMRNSATNEWLEDAGVYEIVALTSKLGADRMNITSISGGGSRNFTVAGVWLKGAYRTIGGSDHSDTIQAGAVLGGAGIENLTIENSVLFPSAGTTLIFGAIVDDITFRNVWAARCGYAANDVPPGYECTGSQTVNFHAVNPDIGTIFSYDSDFYGTFNLNSQTIEITNVNATNLFDGTVIDHGGSVIDLDLPYQEPTMLDLDTIWD